MPGWRVTCQVKPRDYTGRGSFEHRTLIAWACERLKSLGWRELAMERTVAPNRHPVDLTGISPGGVFTGFEITVSTKNNLRQTRAKSFGHNGIQEINFLCCTQTDFEKTQRLLDGDPTLVTLRRAHPGSPSRPAPFLKRCFCPNG